MLIGIILLLCFGFFAYIQINNSCTVADILENHFKAEKFNTTIKKDNISFLPFGSGERIFLEVNIRTSSAYIKTRYPHYDILKIFDIKKSNHCILEGGPFSISKIRDMI